MQVMYALLKVGLVCLIENKTVSVVFFLLFQKEIETCLINSSKLKWMTTF